MKKKFLLTFCCTLITLMAAAQASGGQIKRPAQRKPSSTTSRPAPSSKPRGRKVQTEQSEPAHTPPAVQTVPLGSLAKYNLVVGSYSLEANALYWCNDLKKMGYDSFIYLENNTNPPMYRLIAASSYMESEILSLANKLKKDYPGLWVLFVENGQTYKMQIQQ